METLTRTEETLRTLWIKVLRVVAIATADIGLHSAFQALGCKSFLLVHLQHAIKREIGIGVHLFQFRQAEDLRGMAGLIERERGE